MESLYSLENKLNKMRGFPNWDKSPIALDLMRKINVLNEVPGGKYCVLIPVEVHDPDETVTYMGSLHQSNRYVKDYKNGKIKYTYKESEAKKFTNDIEGTQCMRQCIKDGATHIVVWSYEDLELRCQGIHYPNEHWSDNGKLQPLLMHHTVGEYCENKY